MKDIMTLLLLYSSQWVGLVKVGTNLERTTKYLFKKVNKIYSL